jgi:urea-proton symporter
VFFGVFMGFLSLILDEIGLSLGFVYLMMGIFIGSAVMPISFVLTWDKANATGAVCGAITGLILGLVTWIATASGLEGKVNIDTLGMNYPMLAGNVVAIRSRPRRHVLHGPPELRLQHPQRSHSAHR